VKDDNSKTSTTLVSSSFGFIKSRLQNAMNSVVSGAGDIKTIRDAGLVLSGSKTVTDQYDPEREVTTIGSLNIDTKTYSKYDDETAFSWLIKNDFDTLKDFFTNKDTGLFASINKAIDEKITPNDNTGLIWAAEQAGGKIQTQTGTEITNEKNRLDTVKGDLIVQFSRINGVISYYQTLSDALEKQFAYLNNMIKGK
jgi:flagellar capping protein FliD